MEIPPEIMERARGMIRSALEEDAPAGDITTELLIPPHLQGRGVFLAREGMVIAGMEIAHEVFRLIEAGTEGTACARDGDLVPPGTILSVITSSFRTLLLGERLALNLLIHLSGIATLSRRYMEAVEGLPVEVRDTRKTLPNLRELEKYAVRAGGCMNHRGSLSEGILIKDNHIEGAGGMREALRKVVKNAPPDIEIEVEVRNLGELEEALEFEPHLILLDNFTVDGMREAVRMINESGKRVALEASGGIRLHNLKEVASTGVRYISTSAIITSAPWMDIKFKIDPL